MSEFKTCSDLDVWRRDIVAHISGCLQGALAARGSAVLCVSGGSTPVPIYNALSEQDLDWANVDIALVDERWVEPDHSASNEKLIRETLLINNAASARLTGMKLAGTHIDAEARLNENYNALGGLFDVVLLGLGSDGHTASLYPHAKGLSAALDTDKIVAAITANRSEVSGEYVERMTLTGPAIASAKSIILALRGKEKKRVWESALLPGDNHDMPIRVFNELDSLTVYWVAS